MTAVLEIEVRYKKPGVTAWEALRFSPSEYFWRDPDQPNGPWTFDDVTNHLHVAELVKDQPIEFGVTRVTDVSSGSYIHCAYHYWGGKEDFTCVVTRSTPDGISRELIFSGRMPYKDNGSHLVRVTLDGDLPVTNTNIYMWGEGGDEFEESVLGAPAT
jgi:hypothetical protein